MKKREVNLYSAVELAAAHSFHANYILTGNRGEQVKQIGNSVPVMTAAAMCEVDLNPTFHVRSLFKEFLRRNAA